MLQGGRGRAYQFAVLCTHALLFQAITFLLRPTASYRAIELGTPTAALGLLAASFAAVPLLAALPAGDAADRFGENRIMVVGTLMIAAASALFVFGGDSYLGLLWSTALLGTGHLLCTVGQQAMVANLVPQGRLDSAFGYYTFAGSVGQAAGPGLIGLFGPGESVPRTEMIFVTGAAVAGLLVGVTLLARRTPRRRRPTTDSARRVTALLRLPGLLPALLVSSVVLSSMDIVIVFLPALGTEHGLAAGVVGVLLMVRAVASMASRLFLGRLVKLMGRRWLLSASVVMSGIATALLPVPMPVPLLAVVVVVLGFGFGACQPVTLSWLAELAPPGAQGRVMSIRVSGNRLGQVVIPSSVGLVAAGLGSAGVLWVTAAALLGMAAVATSVPMGARPTWVD